MSTVERNTNSNQKNVKDHQNHVVEPKKACHNSLIFAFVNFVIHFCQKIYFRAYRIAVLSRDFETKVCITHNLNIFVVGSYQKIEVKYARTS